MNIRIGCIARRQSQLGGFVPSPSLEHVEESFSSNGGDDDDDASGFGSGFEYDNEMMTSQ